MSAPGRQLPIVLGGGRPVWAWPFPLMASEPLQMGAKKYDESIEKERGNRGRRKASPTNSPDNSRYRCHRGGNHNRQNGRHILRVM